MIHPPSGPYYVFAMRRAGETQLGPRQGQPYRENDLVTVKGRIAVCSTEDDARRFCPAGAVVVALAMLPGGDFVMLRRAGQR